MVPQLGGCRMRWTHVLVTTMLVGSVIGSFIPSSAQESKQPMMDSLFESTHLLYKSMVLDKLITLDMSPAWWQRMNQPKGINSLVYVTRDIGNFGKKMGWGDPEDVELCFDGTKEQARPKVQGVIDNFAGKVSLTVEAKSPAVTDEQLILAAKYMESVAEVLGREDWKPVSGVAHIKLVLSPTAKTLTSKPELDGKHFTVVAPLGNEPNSIVRTISDGFRRKPATTAAH